MKNNFKKNVFFSILYQIIVAFSGFILPKFFISEYGSSINGSIATISQIIGFFGLVEAGMGSVASVAYYKSLKDGEIENLTIVKNTIKHFYKIIAIVSLGISLGLSIVLPFLLKNGYSFSFNFELAIIVSFSYFIQYYLGLTSQLLLVADFKSYINSISQIVATILNLTICIFLILENCDIRIVKLISGLVMLIRPLILFIVVKRKYKFSNIKARDNNLLKQRWNNFGQSLAFYIHSQTDMFIIMLFLTVSENSVYSVYLSIIGAIKTIVTAIISNFNPILGRACVNLEENKTQVKNIFLTFIKSNNSLINILFSVTAILIIPFMQLYSKGFDYNYIRPEFAYILCLSEYLYLFRTPYNTLINVCGHFKETQISAFLEAGINIVLSILFVNLWGITGVVLATAVAMLYRLIYTAIYSKKKLYNYPASEFVKSIILAVLSFILVAVVIYYVDFSFINNYFIFFIVGAVSVILFAIFQLLILGVFYFSELKKIFKKLINKKSD